MPRGSGSHLYGYASQNPLRFIDLLGLVIGQVDRRIKPFFDCALSSTAGQRYFRFFQEHPSVWDIRPLEGGHSNMGPRGRQNLTRYVDGHRVNLSTLDEPYDPPWWLFWRDPRNGQFWIEPPLEGRTKHEICVQLVKSLIHEAQEFSIALGEERDHKVVHQEIGDYAGLKEAQEACRQCCPPPHQLSY